MYLPNRKLDGLSLLFGINKIIFVTSSKATFLLSKNSGIDLPDKEILKRCWNKNPHGAGFMFNNNNKIIIKKAFFRRSCNVLRQHGTCSMIKKTQNNEI